MVKKRMKPKCPKCKCNEYMEMQYIDEIEHYYWRCGLCAGQFETEEFKNE